MRNPMNERISKNIQNSNQSKLEWQSLSSVTMLKIDQKKYYSIRDNEFIHSNEHIFAQNYYFYLSCWMCVFDTHTQSLMHTDTHTYTNSIWLWISYEYNFFLSALCTTSLPCIWSLWCWGWGWCGWCCCWWFRFSDDIRKSSMDQFVMWIFDRISSFFAASACFFFCLL